MILLLVIFILSAPVFSIQVYRADEEAFKRVVHGQQLSSLVCLLPEEHANENTKLYEQYLITVQRHMRKYSVAIEVYLFVVTGDVRKSVLYQSDVVTDLRQPQF